MAVEHVNDGAAWGVTEANLMRNDVWSRVGFADFFLHELTGCSSVSVDAVYFAWCMLSSMCWIVCSHWLAALISFPHRGVLYKPQHQHDSQCWLLQPRAERKYGREKRGKQKDKKKKKTRRGENENGEVAIRAANISGDKQGISGNCKDLTENRGEGVAVR